MARGNIPKQLKIQHQEHTRKERAFVKRFRIDLLQRLIALHGAKCSDCPEILEIKEMTIDHIKPLKLYGTSDLKNLQILCRSCNRKKASKYDGKLLVNTKTVPFAVKAIQRKGFYDAKISKKNRATADQELLRNVFEELKKYNSRPRFMRWFIKFIPWYN